MKKKKIIILVVIVLLIIGLAFFFKSLSKKIKNGNNINSQQIVDKILNIKSYKTTINVQVNSNKNQNRYILYQEYNLENGNLQEVKEPTNIAGTKIIKKDDVLTIQNTELNLKTIFENYKGLESNDLDLNAFIMEYKENDNSNFEDKEEIIMKTINQNFEEKILYINKENIKPTKMVVRDNNHNSTIIIEYNEIELY